ncbi:hypothetical protein AMTR_s00210p00022040 [Amborella trichopoda]|uniref:NAC domain-containing protein n=1 Tax=Amborella trichopoda TaxID=13333 RepID=W1NTX3_AMBTC|nr:hypothetical protein AMTR_s00210p00022040 [Amborella trichopoda]
MVYKEDEWYFFATTTRLPNECLTTTGHWRDISQAKEIFDRRDRYLGSRFTLTLILDNPRQDTEWYLDEFHLSSEIPQRNGTFIHSNQDTTQSLPSSPLLVLCKIYKEEDYCDSQSGTPLETENLGSVFDA